MSIDRRSFLGISVAAGGAAVTGISCTGAPSPETVKTAPPADFELNEVTVGELGKGMDEGKWSSEQVVGLYLERIDQLNLKGPELRAVLEVNPDALRIARDLDRERRDKGPRGPLHGVPVLLKDNIDTGDGMTTTAGSLALEGSVAKQDSFVAERLRAAGAVLLGKANMSEWANFRSERSSSGWSGRGGQCRNPYVLDRNPCGSSSGSGVAVSANLCTVAIGTETNGSIVCPATTNGIVGLKPTVGLVSRSGIIPISHTQDTAGPMTRSVTDAALVLTALAGVDPRDAATAASAGRTVDLLAALKPDALSGARIGVVRRFFGFHEQVDRLMEEALDKLKQAGAVLVDPADFPSKERYGEDSYQVMLYEFKEDLNAYLSGLRENVKVRSLEDLIRFNEEQRDREMPWFQQEIFLASQAKGPLSSKEYVEALAKAKRLSGPEGIDKLMDENKLDALVAPTGGPAWVTDLVNGDHGLGGSSTPAAVAGYPNITVPMGAVFGLPVGISFFGRAWSEEKLLSLAFSFEQIAPARRAPEMLPTLRV